ncbi:glycosyltransferase family A protein [Streptomyces sp. NPDC051183]|uniref:glycosyltransferase family 2 protein n=1 Tax=unclassified Streptomyces TaxID=2593676 RepID=UPI00341BB80D
MDKRSAGTVGVVIPARDGELVIDQALASLAAQDVPVDEVVVVDDGSTDHTARRARTWRARLPLTVLSYPHPAGIGVARHRGIGALRTDLVMQLDADDALLPRHTRLMREAYAARPGLISPRPLVWDGGERACVPTYLKNAYPQAGDQLAQLLVHCYVVVGALYSRRVYEQVGGYRACRFAEDWDLWLRMVAGSVFVTKLPEPTYLYRVHASYSAGFDIRQAQVEPLERFLTDCRDPHYRAIAKLSILQRIGAAYLERFARLDPARYRPVLRDLAIGDPVEIVADPDLGLIVHGPSGLWVIAEQARRARVLFHRRHTAGPDYIEDESLRLRWSSLRETGLAAFGLTNAGTLR